MQQNSTHGTSMTSGTHTSSPDLSTPMSSMEARRRGAGQAQTLATIGLVGSAVWTTALAALHVLRPDVNDTSTISAYAVGAYGWLMTVAFIALGLGAVALAVGICGATTRSRWSLVGSVLMGLFGLGFVVAGIFPVGGCRDIGCVERFESGANVSMSAAAIAHGVGALLGIMLSIIGMLVLSRTFKRNQRWFSLWTWSLALGLLALIQFFLAGEGMVGAILVRTLVVTLVLWMVLVALRLRSSARDTAV